MNCSEFVARFTDYADGEAPPTDVEAMEEHLGSCESCRRYRSVVEHGAALLRSLPAPELREDFQPRLQHRLYHVQEERSLPEQVTSRTPAFAVFGIALLLTAVAWSPLLRGSAPVIQLEPIVVDRAPTAPRVRPVSTQRRPLQLRAAPALNEGLWDDTRLLYEYSPLSRRYDDLRPRQVGLAPD
ncbi:MAG TPA: zf-HC2 domain-containing protein [Longimicrobiales bacterium]|nr:zf-HC2 domain-containing protein [Longimicrobiales bacterium]